MSLNNARFGNAVIASEAKQSKSRKGRWIASSLTRLAMTVWQTSRRNDFLALLAESLDAERDHVADVEEFRRFHAGADAGRRTRGDDVAGQQRHDFRDVGN